MIRVTVASKNPVKINCTKSGFTKVFPHEEIAALGVSYPSGVSDQPMSDEETWAGARNRAEAAKKGSPESDYWVGIEGGLEEVNGEMKAFAWIYILSEKQSGQSRTSTFELPKAVTDLIHQGIELGKADDIVFKRDNSKQKDGACGILTHGLIDRANYYEPSVILALIPFVNQELY